MTPRTRITGALLPLLLLLCSCGAPIARYQGRRILLDAPELKGWTEGMEMINTSQIDDSHIILDAGIPVTVMAEKKGGTWIIREIRMPDGKWEKVGSFTRALQDARDMETRRRMLELSLGLLRYAQAKGSFPPTCDIVDLTDRLYPHYALRLQRDDAWNNSLRYQAPPGPTFFRLTSAGPDGRFDTADDLILQDGRFLEAGEAAAQPSSPSVRKEP